MSGEVSYPSPGPSQAFSTPDQCLLPKPESESGICVHAFMSCQPGSCLRSGARVMGLGLESLGQGWYRAGPKEGLLIE